MTSATRTMRPRAATVLARFVAARRGATALEFAIVAMPFLFMIFAVFEIALIFMVNVTLESAVITAARQIRTGQNLTVNGLGTSPSYNYTAVNTFRQLVCSYMSWQQTQCSAGVAAASSSSATTDSLVVDIRDPASFGSLSEPGPTNSSNQLLQYDGTKSFCSGVAGGVVVVRAFYPWKIITPFLATYFTKDANGDVVLQAASVFKNEPYGASSSSC